MGRDDAEGYAVEHRKFGKLVDQLKELTAAQAKKVVAALHRRGDGDAVCQIIERRVSEAPKWGAPQGLCGPHFFRSVHSPNSVGCRAIV